MKYLTFLLVALATSTFTMALKSDDINGERIIRSKGDDDDRSGKGKVSLER